MKHLIFIGFLLGLSAPKLLNAQSTDWQNARQAGLVFGLTQPIFVSGFNIEGVYIHKRFIFDYSHGASLKFSGPALTLALRDQLLVVHAPYTTGFGVGYRFTKWLNLRVEPKWHRFDFYYEGEERTAANRIASNNTFSLGLGLYGFLQPFSQQNNALKGLTIAPSVRFWPTVVSDIDAAGISYANKFTGTSETLRSLDPGFGFTPWIFNISIGYMLDVRKK